MPARETGTALHGDRVQVEITRTRSGRGPRGRIVRVLKHANKHMIGRLLYMGKGVTIFPKNQKINRFVEIHRKLDPSEYPDGAWVEVEIRRWSDHPDQPLVGRVTEVLGEEGDPGLPVLLLIRERGVRPEFPPEVIEQAERLRSQQGGKALARGRTDLRDRRIFTVDPATAKDFDDAIHLEALPNGDWRVGVHIADVSHYVKPETELDREALERALSIYPIDRVVPMLPEPLSNDLCSLRPGVDRATLSVFFTIGPEGRLSDIRLCESVIHSVRRFAYEEVQGLFDQVDERAGGEPAPGRADRPRPVIPEALHEDLMQLRRAARVLRQARRARGMLDLELPEPEVLFDAQGQVRDLTRREHFEAHKLIEEMMIAANEAVARHLARHEMPLLYRVHAEPDEMKVKAAEPVMARLGIKLPESSRLPREVLQKAIDAARKHPASTVIQRWMLRAMMRAKYQPENIGHYGLASDCYCHFTSPIRRYPDLVVHRAVRALLRGARPGGEEVERFAQPLEDWGRHTSEREERAQHIEWDAEELLALQFMRRYLGDVFEGFIAGVSPMGFFVELKQYPVEGLVRIGQLDDDYYDLDEEYQIWRGRSSGRTWTIGDAVTVMVERIDALAGQMDLLLLRHGERAPASGASRRRKDRRHPGTPRRRSRRK